MENINSNPIKKIFINILFYNYQKSFWLLFLIAQCSVPFITSGQEVKFTLKGKIFDAEDSTLLPYVNIQIKGSFIGTNSTEVGDFIFHVPDTLLNDTIVFSSIGYTTKKRTVKSILNQRDTLFGLNKSSILMDEISIFASTNDSIYNILKGVRKKFNKNYPTRKHLMNGFIRKITADINPEDSVYTALVEAAFKAQAKSYKQNEDIRCDVNQYRKSYNTLQVNYKANLLKKALVKAAEFAFGYEERNELYGTYHYALYEIRKWSEADFLEGYDIKVISSWEDEGDNFMKIRFQEVLSSEAFPYFNGYLTINLSDYAIVEFYKQQVAHPTKTVPAQKSNYLNGEYYKSIHILFRAYENNYFPRYINYKVPSFQTYESNISGKVYDLITIMFSNAEYTLFNKIKKSESLQKDKYIEELEIDYDAFFWSNYNAIPETPLSRKVTQQLERERTLEEQYKN